MTASERLLVIENHFGIRLPRAFREWSLKSFNDCAEHRDRYLWVNEAEWIPLQEIPSYDLRRKKLLIRLIPFAFNGAGDTWCWNLECQTGDDEYEVLLCPHDEELATVYAPTFPAWFYRTCLDYAASVDNDRAAISDARQNLLLWSDLLGGIGSTAWSVHLTQLGHAETRRGGVDFGFLTRMEVERIVNDEIGEHYLMTYVEWGSWK